MARGAKASVVHWMRRSLAPASIALTLVLGAPGPIAARRLPFTDSFMIEECQFASRGRNPYLILEPGHQLTLEGQDDGGLVRLVVTVLDDTERIGDVETRVVEERETLDGELIEVSRNFFALCAPTNSVFYFGEDVDDYEGGIVVGHDGAWRAGAADARPGVIMPGLNLVGARYVQEIAPGVALDRAETLSVSETVSTPAGVFTGALKVKETTPLERKSKSVKLYAPGIGLVQDGVLRLVSVSAP